MTRETRIELVENEWFHVRYSGETPEIALHSSLYYLTQDPEGPGLVLEEGEQSFLIEAASQRYCDIIFRDILPENRDSSIYRGPLRSICNWRRYKRFCLRHDQDWLKVRDKVASRVVSFLRVEVEEVEQGARESSINCTVEDLRSFALELEVDLGDIHCDIGRFCSSLSN